ncbi:MAG: Ulp1 family isopeptidase [Simkaniaceae bacterium]
MKIPVSDAPKALAFNFLAGLGYYIIASHYKLYRDDLLHSHLAMHTISSVVYTSIKTQWNSSQTFDGMDILPIASLLLTKVQEVSWKTQMLITTVLSGSQISAVKYFAEDLPYTPPSGGLDTKWLSNYDIVDYYPRIKALHPKDPEPLLGMPFLWGVNGLSKEIIGICEERKYRELFMPLHVTSNHWTLIYVNLDTRVVEYYDSKQNYGNFEEITATLKTCAADLSEKFPGDAPFTFESKIQKKLQPDPYQCGVWVLYFIQKLCENPRVDFNALEIGPAQRMIADFRKTVIPYFTCQEWKR